MFFPLLFATAVSAEPAIPFVRYELPNGLDVTLSADHSVPFVCVNVWYDVGSKDEVPGRSGFAHLFEHLMFNGSKHADEDFFKPLDKLGARLNGSTNLDRTNYYECLPSEELPRALFLEADRMGWLLEALTLEKLLNQKDVVRNERRQNYDNPPYGHSWLELLRNTFPEGHPYHIATIGRHEEIDAAQLDDVKAFFRKWYLPNNASLVLTGDFDDAVARQLVDRYFGPVARGPQPEHLRPAPIVLTEDRRVVVVDKVPFEKVWIVWPTPAVFEPGDADLDLLASALSAGKESRLYTALVHDLQLAQDVNTEQGSQAWQSLFIIRATASEGHTGAELVAAIDTVLTATARSGITQREVDVGRTAFEVGFFHNLSTIQGKADLLNRYNVRTGDPGYLGKDLARYTLATTDSVAAALTTWLPLDKRLVLTFVPEVK